MRARVANRQNLGVPINRARRNLQNIAALQRIQRALQRRAIVGDAVAQCAKFGGFKGCARARAN